jgi:hypothetical protein
MNAGVNMASILADPRLYVSFLVGGCWVAFTTLIADRFGNKLGGWLGGLPSTVLVSLFFIGLTQSPEQAAEATTTVPLGMGLNGLFLVLYAALARWGFASAVGGALVAWLAIGMPVALAMPSNYVLSLLTFVLLLVGSHWAFERLLRIGSSPGTSMRFTLRAIIGRGVLGGLMIAVSVVLARIAGPRLGGLFAALPSVFLATITIAYLSQGMEFSRTVAKPLMVSGLINVTVYATAVRFFYPILGLLLGTLASFAIAVLSSLLTYRFIQRGMT